MKRNLFPALFVLAVLLCTCEKFETVHTDYKKDKGIFILCEGNYFYGNASMSFYQPDSMIVANDVFKSTNNFDMGDVAQSMILKDSTAFVVMNNSGKILVMNANTFKYLRTITGLTSPRYLLLVNDTKAYVSDLYSNSVSIINIASGSVSGSINMKKTTEQMVRYEDYVIVNNWSKENTVERIDTRTDQLVDSITITRQPNSMVLDKYNKLWVLSDGGFQGDAAKEMAALTRIDAATFQIEKVYTFPSPRFSPSRLCINGSSDTIFFLSGGWMNSNSENGIYRMSVTDQQLPSSAFIPQNKKLFYGLAVDPKTSEIYTTDAVDYQQRGWVFRYRPNASKVDSFRAGIIPSFFCFK